MNYQIKNKQGTGYRAQGKCRVLFTLHPEPCTLCRGYTLLFAVLTAALVLGVAVFILEISTKQYELSASARDSMYSFYAADSGIECVALNGSGGLSGTTDVYDWSNPSNTITCGYSSGVNVPYTGITYSYQGPPSGSDPFATTTQFSLQLSPTGSQPFTCAMIYITEYHDGTGGYHDIVQSRGYNHCSVSNGILGPDTSNPTTVERALQLSHSTD